MVLSVHPVRGQHVYDPVRPAGDPRNDYVVTAELVSGRAAESLMLEVKPTSTGQEYILPSKRVGEGRYRWVLKGLSTSATMEIVAPDLRLDSPLHLAGPQGAPTPMRPLHVKTTIAAKPPPAPWSNGQRAARDYLAHKRSAYELVVLVMSYAIGSDDGPGGAACRQFIDGACEAFRQEPDKAMLAGQLRSALTRAAHGRRPYEYFQAVGARCARGFAARSRGEVPDPRETDNPETTLKELAEIVVQKLPIGDRLTIKAGFISGCMDAGCSREEAETLFRAFRAPLQSRWLPPIETE
jgi:hypothetical protein